MERQVIVLEAASVADDTIVDDEALDVYCWRMEQLLQAGYVRALADALADDTAVDLHLACDLLARGCDENTAFRILS